MATTKKTKAANDTKLAAPFIATAWESLFGLADDTRAECHKQMGALLGFAEGALSGVVSYASGLNDRADHLVREGLLAADKSGRALAARAAEATGKALASSRTGSTTLVATTRDGVKAVAERASSSARVLLGEDKIAKAA